MRVFRSVKVTCQYIRFANLRSAALLDYPNKRFVEQSSPFNLALLNFEVTQQGFGMYVKYLMSGFLIIFALAMLFQFANFMIDELNKLEKTGEKSKPASAKVA